MGCVQYKCLLQGLGFILTRLVRPGPWKAAAQQLSGWSRIQDALRQDSLLHDVGEGVEHALPHVSLQRGVEVGNDLKARERPRQCHQLFPDTAGTSQGLLPKILGQTPAALDQEGQQESSVSAASWGWSTEGGPPRASGSLPHRPSLHIPQG